MLCVFSSFRLSILRKPAEVELVPMSLAWRPLWPTAVMTYICCRAPQHKVAPIIKRTEFLYIGGLPTIRIKGLDRLSGGRGLMASRMLAGVSAFIHSRRLKVPYDVIEYPEWGAEG